MAYNDGVIGVDLDATVAGTGTSSNEGNDFEVGKCVTASDGQKYMYVHASAAIAQYDVVGISETFEAAPLTKAMADDGWFVGAAQVAFADNDFGWVCVGGVAEINVLASCAPDVALCTSGTAGKLDDDTTSQTKIDGIVQVDAAVTSAANTTALMTFPRSASF